MTPVDDVIDAQAEDDARRWRAIDIALAVVSALVITWGVLAAGWSLFAVMALFWLENVVIGAFNVMKMLFAGALGGAGAFVGALFMSAFFSVHYGLFTLVHGIFVVMLFGGEAGIGSGGGMFGLLGRMIGWLLGNREAVFAMLAIVALHASALVRWLLLRIAADGRQDRGENLFAAPYGRIVVLHMALILGAGLVIALKLPQAGVLLLVALKLAYDIKVALSTRPTAQQRLAALLRGLPPPRDFLRKERFRGRP